MKKQLKQLFLALGLLATPVCFADVQTWRTRCLSAATRCLGAARGCVDKATGFVCSIFTAPQAPACAATAFTPVAPDVAPAAPAAPAVAPAVDKDAMEEILKTFRLSALPNLCEHLGNQEEGFGRFFDFENLSDLKFGAATIPGDKNLKGLKADANTRALADATQRLLTELKTMLETINANKDNATELKKLLLDETAINARKSRKVISSKDAAQILLTAIEQTEGHLNDAAKTVFTTLKNEVFALMKQLSEEAYSAKMEAAANPALDKPLSRLSNRQPGLLEGIGNAILTKEQKLGLSVLFSSQGWKYMKRGGIPAILMLVLSIKGYKNGWIQGFMPLFKLFQ